MDLTFVSVLSKVPTTVLKAPLLSPFSRFRNHRHHRTHLRHCPLWVFLRSGLAVPKEVARKPLPQKVSSVDSGICIGFSSLADGICH